MNFDQLAWAIIENSYQSDALWNSPHITITIYYCQTNGFITRTLSTYDYYITFRVTSKSLRSTQDES